MTFEEWLNKTYLENTNQRVNTTRLIVHKFYL
jgi:ribosomal protein L33